LNSEKSHKLDRLFYPRSIAVVGASTGNNSHVFGGNSPILGSIKQNFNGHIYPINPKAERILGYKAYPSVRDIPGEVDLVIFTIPVSAVQQVMEDCAAKKVKFVHLYTAGFKETGREELAEIEDRITEFARKSGTRIIGPNCMGLYCPDGGLAWSDIFPHISGPIGIFSQSGQLANHFIDQGIQLGLSYSKVVSYGNASDLQASDFLDYLGQDEKTKIIGSYIEGLRDGRTFFETAKRVTREKPLVVYKGGQTEGGSRATSSHTAAIAGSPRIWRGLCRQAGIIPVESKEEFIHTLAALNRLPLPQSREVVIFGGAGGGSVTMTDMAERIGLKVPPLPKEAIERMEAIMPLAGHSVKNPIDLVPAFFNRDFMMEIISIVKGEPNLGAMIVYIFTPGPVPGNLMNMGAKGVDMFCRNMAEAKEKIDKPMVFVLERDSDVIRSNLMAELEKRFRETGLTVFPTFNLAAKALVNLSRYQEFLLTQK